MHKGRLIFWSISGLLIASGVGFYVYLQIPATIPMGPLASNVRADAAKQDDVAPASWSPKHPWWKAQTIDAYDAVNKKKTWPSGRRAVVAFGRLMSSDPYPTGDEIEDLQNSALVAVDDYEATDPLLLFLAVRYRTRQTPTQPLTLRNQRIADAFHAFSTSENYPAFIRCMAAYEAAILCRSGPRPTKPLNWDVCVDFAKGLLPAIADDPELPLGAALELMEIAGEAAPVDGRDRAQLLLPILTAFEKSGKQSTSFILTMRGSFLVHYAWDARGGGWANSVSQDGWKTFTQRLNAAKEALEKAWELDRSNAIAASHMITVCMGLSSGRPEVEKWFKRAIQADPAHYDACSRKLLCLEPKWGGSVVDMVMFGREICRGPVEAGPAQLRRIMVDVHWQLQQGPEYFEGNDDAWSDVSQAYEAYLKFVPESRYHRTRYAVIAGWSGKWDVCKKQFDVLGKDFSHRVVPDGVVSELIKQANAKR